MTKVKCRHCHARVTGPGDAGKLLREHWRTCPKIKKPRPDMMVLTHVRLSFKVGDE